MRGIIGILFLLLTMMSYQENKNKTAIVKQTDWENRKSEIEDFGHLDQEQDPTKLSSCICQIFHYLDQLGSTNQTNGLLEQINMSNI